MPNTILLKRNATVGATPATLAAGELALNSAEAKLYAQNSSGVIVPVVKTEDRVLDGGVITPNVTYTSPGTFFIGSADHFAGDKWAFMDENLSNATWSVTLSVQYLVINGVLLVANQAAVPDPLFGRLITSEIGLSHVINSTNPPYYGAYSPYTTSAPRNYIDFMNNLWEAAQYASSTPVPPNWKADNNLQVVYSLPTTMSFHVILKEVFNLGTGTYHNGNAVNAETYYEIRTKKIANSTAQKIEDTFTNGGFYEWG